MARMAGIDQCAANQMIPGDVKLLAYGVREAAVRLNTSSKKVYQMCLAGQLRCERIGGRIRIPLDDIERREAGR
jgi:excisionase family DNA binding protein